MSAQILAVLGLVALVVLSAPAGASAAGKSKVRFSASTYQQAENGVSAVIKLTRTRNLRAPATVGYSTATGSATAGSDYRTTTGTLIFPALRATDTAKSQTATFSVPLIDDRAVEPNETVNLRLKGSRTATVGGGRAVLTIVDDDGAPRLSFESASATVAETAGATSVTVIRSGDASETAEVTYGASANGTAAGRDWSFPSTDRRLKFARNQRIASFGVTLHDNADVDGARTLELSLASPLRATLEEPLLTTLTILDDETPSILRFDAVQSDVNEADGVATLTVTRAGSYTGQTVTVGYSVHGVDASAGADYTDSSGTLTLDGPDPDDPGDPGDVEGTIEVPIADDAVDEANETLEVRLDQAGANAVLGSPIAAAVTIIDNDEPLQTGGSTGGDTDGSTGGDTGGDTGGSTGGSTGGDSGGSTGGDTGGSTDGDSGGSTGGDTANAPAGSPLDPAAGGMHTTGVAQAAPRSGLKVSASVGKKQRILRARRVSLRVRCNSSCSVSVRVTIKVRPRGKGSGGRKARVLRRTVRLRAVGRQIAGGKATVVKLRLSKQSRTTLKRALGGRKRMRVIVRVTARDGSGASVSLKKGVRRRA